MLVRCEVCRREEQAGLQGTIESRQGDVPLKNLTVRSTAEAPRTLIPGWLVEVPGALLKLADSAGQIVGRCGGRDTGGTLGFSDQHGLSVLEFGNLLFRGR